MERYSFWRSVHVAANEASALRDFVEDEGDPALVGDDVQACRLNIVREVLGHDPRIAERTGPWVDDLALFLVFVFCSPENRFNRDGHAGGRLAQLVHIDTRDENAGPRIVAVTPCTYGTVTGSIHLESIATPCDVPLVRVPDVDLADLLLRTIETQINPRASRPLLVRLDGPVLAFALAGLDRIAFEEILGDALVLHDESSAFVQVETALEHPARISFSRGPLSSGAQALVERIIARARPSGFVLESKGSPGYLDNWTRRPCTLYSRRRLHTTRASALEAAEAADRIAGLFGADILADTRRD